MNNNKMLDNFQSPDEQKKIIFVDELSNQMQHLW